MRNIILSIATMAACAVNAQWQQTGGPHGGLMSAPVQVGTDLFVGTYGGGVLRSTNNGVNWEAVNNGLAELTIFHLSVIDSVLYTGTNSGGGMYRSTDHGASWTAVADGWMLTAANSILIEGLNIFIGTWGTGIVRSQDGGLTWNWANTGLPGSAGIGTILRCGPYLFCNGYSGVFRSADNGDNWTAVNTTMSQPGIAAIDSTLYIAEYGFGAARSTNYGNSWQAANNGLDPYVNCFTAIGPDLYAGSIAGGVYRSTNGGAQWTLLGSVSNKIASISIVGPALYASTQALGDDGDLYVSLDGGVTWSLTTNDMIATHVESLAVNGPFMHAGTWGEGFFTSPDDGLNWNALNNGLAYFDEVRCIQASGQDLVIGGVGVYQSNDGATNWNSGSAGLTNASVSRMTRIGTNVFAATAGGMFISTNNGSSWAPVNNGLGVDPYMQDVFAQDDTLYACGINGVFTSTNYGNSWTALNNGLQLGTYYGGIVKNHGVLLTFNYNDMYRSTDNGASWSLAMTGISFVGFRAMISQGNVVVVGDLGITHGALFVTSDQGLNWSSITGDIGNTKIMSLCMDGSVLYAGTQGSGVWKREMEGVFTGITAQNSGPLMNVFLDASLENAIVQLGAWEGQKADLVVTDAAGRRVRVLSLVQETTVVPVAELSDGIYLFTVISDPKAYTQRLVLNR